MARLILGAMFLYMGYQKITHPVEFLKQIRLYGLLPESPPFLLNGTAVVLPFLEVLTGSVLVLGVLMRGAAAIQLAMLTLFSVAIFLRALKIHGEEGTPFFEIAFDCGCGSGVVITWKKLLSNSALMLLTLIPLWTASRRFCLSRLWLARSGAGHELP